MIAITAGNSQHLVEQHISNAGAELRTVICEPTPRNTAPALAAASAYLLSQNNDAPVVALPSDHVISDAAKFAAVLRDTLPSVHAGKIALIGVVPDRPDTGLGYIETEDGTNGGDILRKVRRFIEKPNFDVAAQLITTPNVYWNAGIFVFRPSVLMAELYRFSPQIAQAASDSVTQGETRESAFHLNAEQFARCPNEQIDTAVMERTNTAVCAPATFDWCDVGSWDSVWRFSEKDERNNATKGNTLLVDVSDTQVFSTGPLVVGLGVKNLVISATEDAILVADRKSTDKLRQVVGQMQASRLKEADDPTRENRPWGTFQKLGGGDNYQVKEIHVLPGHSISLQRHQHRNEIWVVVKGIATVRLNDGSHELGPGESIHIPAGAIHRIANDTDSELRFIEIQSGDYLGEDDIERLEDVYGRA